jgi:hypothetical protein
MAIIGQSTFGYPVADNALLDGTALELAPEASVWVETGAVDWRRNAGAQLNSSAGVDAARMRSDYQWPTPPFEVFIDVVSGTNNGAFALEALEANACSTTLSGYAVGWERDPSTLDVALVVYSSNYSEFFEVADLGTVGNNTPAHRIGLRVLTGATDYLVPWVEPFGGGARTTYGAITPTADLRANRYAGFVGSGYFTAGPRVRLWAFDYLGLPAAGQLWPGFWGEEDPPASAGQLWPLYG